jgi:23S rRNA (cytosine1962-C5)-methyltransferase
LFRNDLPGRDLEGLAADPDLAAEVAVGPADGKLQPEVEVLEQGLEFVAPLSRGQKTGWFYDQRDNRAQVAGLVAAYGKDSRVLDAFSYVGGFGCAAAATAKAKEVTFLDASEEALRLAACNAAHNLPYTDARTLAGDAVNLLTSLREDGRSFEVVCLDPPAFIKRKKDETAGLGAYQQCNELALDLVADGGLLISSSCSQHLATETFRQVLARAAARRRKTVRIIGMGRQGADHPVPPAMPELEYLKTFFMRVTRT